MSKAISYDSLLVRSLAEALDRRYRDRPIRAVRMSPDRRDVAIVGSRQTLVWNLDPEGGFLGERREPGRPTGLILPRGTRIRSVRSQPDDRVIEWQLETPAEATGEARRFTLWIDLLPNRRSAVLTEAGRILASFGRAGPPGSIRESPEANPRDGSDEPLDRDAFVARLAGSEPRDRQRALLRNVAYTSPLNAPAILGAAASSDAPQALSAAYDRYLRIVDREVQPGIVDPDGLRQPYPVRLDGLAFEAQPDLLAAFESCLPGPADTTAVLDRAGIIDRLARRIAVLERRVERLQAEHEGAAREAARLRRDADLLLARPGLVRRGMAEIEIEDFEGGRVRIELDPAKDGIANANHFYEQARRRDRASQKLPAMVETALREAQAMRELHARAAAGEASDAELEPFAGRMHVGGRAERAGPALPYRRYRTSGGLEVRVGRGARANDELTLRHASPDDVWMHAREVAGAHVVLRWTRREENPPSPDLIEAAVLAALHSRARTSGVVPVDWTRRRYVRKPRGSAPGSVRVERARTLFVEPDEAVEKRLRAN